ncbi:MAG: hypothetical protein Q4A07_08350 [Coriobacteriales bacterium]|nr:hypothetical protein [Coriobacteriales bacterium]
MRFYRYRATVILATLALLLFATPFGAAHADELVVLDDSKETPPIELNEPSDVLTVLDCESDDSVVADDDLGVVVQDSATGPTLSLTCIPNYGGTEYVIGKVKPRSGQSIDFGKYRVTLYVQISDGDQYWVKPYADTPYVDVQPDGSFALKYDTGGANDQTARYLHVLLIPSSYSPELNGFNNAKAASVDYVKITREKSGAYEVEPADRVESYAHPVKSSGLSVSSKRIAVNVGLYTSGSPGDTLTESQIKALLCRVAKVANAVRFYGATGPEATACRIAHGLGLKVITTAQLTGNSTNDKKQMDALVDLCTKGYVQVACVGNETLYANKLTAKKLVADINYVRDALVAAGVGDCVAVTTSETLGLLVQNPYVCNACDVLMPNTYPCWEGVSVSKAPAAFEAAIQNLANSCPGKEIVVSETGWPTAGGTIGKAVAGEAQSRAYFDAVRSWSLSTKTVVLWFAAADEPWKSGSYGEGAFGAHWGFLDKDLRIKDGYSSLGLLAPLKSGALKKANVTLKKTSYTYDRKAKKPSVVVKYGDATFVKGVDYTLSYQDNVNAGTAKVTVKGKGFYAGSVTATFAIAKAANPLSVKAKAKSVSAKTLKQKKVVTKPLVVKGAKGKITYKKVSGSKALTVNASTGKVTVRKGTKKGTYTIKIKVRSSGGANYKVTTKTVKAKVTVK